MVFMQMIRIGAAFVLFRAGVVAALFVGLWTWLVPRWMARGDLVPRWSPAAVVLMMAGGLVMLRCVWDFAWTGGGTPAPFDPPRKLVMTGLYRFVRNPMYVGMGTFLVGEALLLPAITGPMLVLAAVLWAVVTLFVMVYEEPTLRRMFGADYETYCRHVRRWIPRITPFRPD
jgi:protein-S-isoprenylcysteine O-methyltransferase Ste14